MEWPLLPGRQHRWVHRLDGGAGDDTLVGGAWGDILLGGAGHDRDVFGSIADSRLGTHDRILDFGVGALLVRPAGFHRDVCTRIPGEAAAEGVVYSLARDGFVRLYGQVGDQNWAVDLIGVNPLTIGTASFVFTLMG